VVEQIRDREPELDGPWVSSLAHSSRLAETSDSSPVRGQGHCRERVDALAASDLGELPDQEGPDALVLILITHKTGDLCSRSALGAVVARHADDFAVVQGQSSRVSL
jgi:hypothetical protein